MRKWILLVAIAAASCNGKKKDEPTPGAGSVAETTTTGAGSAQSVGGTTATTRAPSGGALPAHAALPATPADTAQADTLAAQRDLAKLAVAPDAAKRGQLVGRIIDELGRSLKPELREMWDPAQIVRRVGRDRAALFRWVRDNTALVPYRGSLRGPSGVLMDRVGNSFDRALLLAELFGKAGIRARLATATLDATALDKLSKSIAAGKRPPKVALDETSDLLDRVAKVLAADPATLKTKEAAVATKWNDLATQARKRVGDQTQALLAQVPTKGGAADDSSSLSEHWWVQAEESGAWTDFDPSFADADPGQTLAAAMKTPGGGEIKDDQRHTLTVRVIAEVWKNGKREEAKLLEHTFAPQRFYGQQILVRSIPIDMPEHDKLLAQPDPPAAARKALAEQTEFMAVLSIGGSPIAGASVTDGGEVWNMTGPDENTIRLARTLSKATKAVGGATDLLGSMPGGGPAPATKTAPPKPPLEKESKFTAQWLEVEVRVPGGSPKLVRRAMFELFDDRASAKPIALSDEARLRRALELTSAIELLPMFAKIPTAFVAERTVKSIVAARSTLVEMVRGRGKVPSKAAKERAARLPPIPGPLYSLAMARFQWSGVADNVYIDRLDVIAQREIVYPSGNDLRRRFVLDFLTNGVGVWPGSDAHATRVEQGVADTVAEALVVIDCPKQDCTRDNTSDYFVAAGAKGWTMLSGKAEVKGPTPRASSLIKSDLALGYTVLASPTHASWWRIDPSTGETLGMGLFGGNAFNEYLTLVVHIGVTGYNCWRALGRGDPESIGWCAAGLAVGMVGGAAALGAAGVDAAAGPGIYRAINTICILLGGLIAVDHSPAPPPRPEPPRLPDPPLP